MLQKQINYFIDIALRLNAYRIQVSVFGHRICTLSNSVRKLQATTSNICQWLAYTFARSAEYQLGIIGIKCRCNFYITESIYSYQNPQYKPYCNTIVRRHMTTEIEHAREDPLQPRPEKTGSCQSQCKNVVLQP